MGDIGALSRNDTRKGEAMDFIERIFGISPDGGDGSTELLFFVAIVAILAAVSWRPIHRRLAARRRTH
jgi:hypothetical protein